MSKMTLKNVCKLYEDKNYAVRDVNLDIEDREFLILVGPSGCGKSTTLRMIAGLEEISSGELWIDGELMNYVPPKERELSMVFQNYALYPNMTVYDNMAFALKIRKQPKGEIKAQVYRVAKILEICHLLDRRPKDLSGGQRQRVAIGSAIIRQPRAFLMDEPLSNLDAKLRSQMRVELAKLHKQLQTTIIYVTHDQTEAMTLGTRIVVMKDGMIQQADTPLQLYENPVNRFVAGFIGTPPMNFLEMRAGRMGEEWFLSAVGCKIPINGELTDILKNGGYENGRIIFGIRPEDIYIKSELAAKKDLKNLVSLRSEIEANENLGAEHILHFRVDGQKMCARIEGECQIEKHENAEIFLNLDKMKLFDPDTEKNLLYTDGGGMKVCSKSA